MTMNKMKEQKSNAVKATGADVKAEVDGVSIGVTSLLPDTTMNENDAKPTGIDLFIGIVKDDKKNPELWYIERRSVAAQLTDGTWETHPEPVESSPWKYSQTAEEAVYSISLDDEDDELGFTIKLADTTLGAAVKLGKTPRWNVRFLDDKTHLRELASPDEVVQATLLHCLATGTLILAQDLLNK
jgi:hypothetical protein